MSNKELPSHWKAEHYKAFLLLYMANADLELNPDELKNIAEKINWESLDEVQRFFSNCNDYDCISLIRSKREDYFPGDEGKELLIDEMMQLGEADGKITTFEEGMMHALIRIL